MVPNGLPTHLTPRIMQKVVVVHWRKIPQVANTTHKVQRKLVSMVTISNVWKTCERPGNMREPMKREIKIVKWMLFYNFNQICQEKCNRKWFPKLIRTFCGSYRQRLQPQKDLRSREKRRFFAAFGRYTFLASVKVLGLLASLTENQNVARVALWNLSGPKVSFAKCFLILSKYTWVRGDATAYTQGKRVEKID